ncbi:MAG TPA: protocatechuate 3,4-dioxygenase subunit alpha [Ktedonobacterales bacterium]
MSLHPTASQTVGPFHRIGLSAMTITDIAGPEVPGERVSIRGRVLDGDGKPVNDALIEVWQANAEGTYAHPDDTQEKPLRPQFLGFGRSPTDDDGAFHFTTIKPGPVPGPDGQTQAPHLVVVVFMRGLLRHLVTRLYFPNEPANETDPILRLVPDERRQTLIARPVAGGTLEWTIRLQGSDETVFFAT